MIGRCYACNGTKKVSGMGCMIQTCRICKGTGEFELPVTTPVSNDDNVVALDSIGLPESSPAIEAKAQASKVARKVFKRVKS